MKKLLVVLSLLWPCFSYALSADAYLIIDMDGKVMAEKNADEVRSIASITKLLIAEGSVKLDQAELIEVTKDDVKKGRMRSTPLRAGKSYTRAQLTELALVSSDNVAANTLGRSVPLDANSLATLVEPTGLNPKNKSTARQLAVLAKDLYTTEVAEISTRTSTEIGNRHSTNPLLTREGWKFYLSKTGFISASGGCLVVITDIAGKKVMAVILGASNTKQRWLDLAELRRNLGDTNFYTPVRVTKVAKSNRRKPG